jgi:hypothetical protein
MVQKKTKTIKRYCIRNTKTRRCNKSEKENATSNECVLFKQTMRCRNLKMQKDVVDFYNYKVNKSVKTYLTNAIIKKSGKKLRERTEGQYLPMKDLQDDKALKDYLVNEILEMSKHGERDENQSEVISLKMVKRVIQNDSALNMVIFNKS